jgi:hypothetical protein
MAHREGCCQALSPQLLGAGDSLDGKLGDAPTGGVLTAQASHRGGRASPIKSMAAITTGGRPSPLAAYDIAVTLQLQRPLSILLVL